MAKIKWKSQEEIDEEVKEANKPTELELQVNAVKEAVKKLIRIDELTEDELNSIMMLYNEYEMDIEYKVDDIFRYEGILYRVILGHKSQKDWKPNELPALYTKIIPSGVIEEWGSRDLTVNPFMSGEKVIFEGEIWESLIDNNVWSPTDYPQGWELITP